VGDTGQRDLDRSPGTSVACRLKPNSWLRKRGRSTDLIGCVQIEKLGTLLFSVRLAPQGIRLVIPSNHRRSPGKLVVSNIL
jgi:hypothetical protein